MASITDDRCYNQGFAPAESTTVRMSRRTDLLLSEMELTQDTRVLEIGCGTGEVSYWMASRSPAHVVGTDLCVPFIEEAKKNYRLPNLRYEVMDVNNLSSFGEEKFDYLVGNGILHHLYPNLDAVFARMRRLLKENGKILFLEPNVCNPYVYLIFSFPTFRALAKLEPDEMAFSKRFITDALSQAGFKDVRVDYKDFLLPGIPSFLIQPSILIGTVLEKLPLVKQAAQSLFIRAYNSSGVTPLPRENSKHREKVLLITRYGISGATAVAIQVVGLYVWVSVLGFTAQYLWGVVIAYGIALFVAFLMQKYWTFREYSRDLIAQQMLWYSVISLGNLGVNALLLHVSKVVLESNGLNFFHSWYLVAQLFAVIICAGIGFLLNWFITFRSAVR